ncbi:MAG TPA: hypothetical protein VG056_03420 [Pirellulales bacterium]|jgi:hypothetical protein|nr:hypothetical protein [Pirellulales bacterium]
MIHDFSRIAFRWCATLVMCGLAFLALVLGAAHYASAGQLLYVTSTSGQQILTADTGTNVVTPVVNTVGQPDSLLFDNNQNIIYSNLQTGQVRRINKTTHSDTLIAGGFNDPADIALEPGGGSLLLSDFAGGQIFRINLTTNAVTTLGVYGGNPQGLAYDNLGRLFANLGTRSGGATSFLAQLDPVTGAILRQSIGLVSLDGLTFDSFSGKLFDPSLAGGGIYQIDPATLAVTLLPGSSGVAFDGITNDAAGNLYIANSGSRIYQYNLPTLTLTPETVVGGLDDLAPAAGLGSTPEPAGLTLLCIGAAGLAGYSWRRSRRIETG